jgi:hypothetical protein
VRHLDKPKAAGATRVPIGHNPDGIHSPIRFEAGTKLLVGGRQGEIPDKNMGFFGALEKFWAPENAVLIE